MRFPVADNFAIMKPFLNKDCLYMSDLTLFLKRIIGSCGPISIADFMTHALFHPEYGFYGKADKDAEVIGKFGHFITSPEISFIFSEILAVFAVYYYEKNSLCDLTFCEPGAGRGTMLRIVDAAIKQMNHKMHERINFLAVDIRKDIKDSVFCGVTSEFTGLPRGPVMLFANEFLDALPIRQYIYRNNQWLEVMVGLSQEDSSLCKSLTVPDAAAAAKINALNVSAVENYLLELPVTAVTFIDYIAAHISSYGGLGVLVDYGYIEPSGHSTLHSVKNHKMHDIMQDAGTADISAHVNFALLQETVLRHDVHCYVINQGTFLKKIGILERLEQLLQYNKDPVIRERLYKDVARLVAPDQMGDLFKILIIADRPIDIL